MLCNVIVGKTHLEENFSKYCTATHFVKKTWLLQTTQQNKRATRFSTNLQRKIEPLQSSFNEQRAPSPNKPVLVLRVTFHLPKLTKLKGQSQTS